MKFKSIIIFAILFLLSDKISFATDCKNLSTLVCLESVKCTLDCKRNSLNPEQCAGKESYFCRSETGECETATNQETLTKEQCEENKNCVFEPGFCFCRCDFDLSCNCECGGGPPRNCLEKNLAQQNTK